MKSGMVKKNLVVIAAIAAFAIPLVVRRVMASGKLASPDMGYYNLRYNALLAGGVVTLLLALVLLVWAGRKYLPKMGAAAWAWLLIIVVLLSSAMGFLGVATGAGYYRKHVQDRKTRIAQRSEKQKEQTKEEAQAAADRKRKQAEEREKRAEDARWRADQKKGEIARIPEIQYPGNSIVKAHKVVYHDKGLSLSSEQVAKVDEAEKVLSEERKAYDKSVGWDRKQVFKLKPEERDKKLKEHAEAFEKIWDRYTEKVFGYLTPEQLDKLEKISTQKEINPILSLSWASDSSKLLINSGGYDRWESNAEDKSRAAFTELVNSARGLIWSPTGGRSSWSIWDVAQKRFTVGKGHGFLVYQSVFLPDNQRIFRGWNVGVGTIWDTVNQTEKTFEGHKWGIRSVALSPSGRLALTGGIDIDHTVRLFDLETSSQLRLIDGFTSGVYSLSMAPDGLQAAAATDGVALLDLNQGVVSRRLYAGEGRTLAVAYSPDGKRLAAGGRDNFIRIWDMENLDKPPLAFAAHNGHVYCLDWTRDGQHIISGGFDHLVRVFDARNGREIHRFDGHQDMVKSLKVSPDGTMVAAGGFDGLTMVWDLRFLREPEIAWLGDVTDAASKARDQGRDLLVYCNGNETPEVEAWREKNHIDVTDKVKALLKDGRLDFTFGPGRGIDFGDPAVCVVKTLTVTYELNGREMTGSALDYKRLILPPRDTEGEITIKRAVFGALGVVDVTEELERRIFLGRLSMNGDFEALGGSPAPCRTQELRVEYEFNGQTLTRVCGVKDDLILPPDGKEGPFKITRAVFGYFPPEIKGVPNILRGLGMSKPMADDRLRRLVRERFVAVLPETKGVELAGRYNVTNYPAVLVFDQGGNMLKKIESPFTADDLLTQLNSRYDTQPVMQTAAPVASAIASPAGN